MRGSAIAAMSPFDRGITVGHRVAMAVVFLLNGIALLIFPYADTFSDSQEQFGFWSALAIHDTSSVAGAAAIYGLPRLL